MATIPFVDLSRQNASQAAAMQEVLRQALVRCDFVLGKSLGQFEKEFALYVGARYAIGVASGTDALHLALRAAGVGPRDEVLIPSLTFAATALAVLYCGARPVPVDVQENNALLDLRAAEAGLSKRTKAIIPVHLYGRSCSMDLVMRFARKHHLAVVEDACQAHGARFKKQSVGTFGLAGCFSFYPSKNLGAYGDGGMIVTQSPRMYERLLRLRNHGQWVKYEHDTVGFNSRLDSLQAGFLSVGLKRLSQGNRARRRLAAQYNVQLRGLPLDLPTIPKNESEHVFHLYVIRTSMRTELQAYLKKRGIETGIHYPHPLHRLKFMGNGRARLTPCPVSEALSGVVLSLPFFPELTSSEVRYVTTSIRSFFSRTILNDGKK